MNPGSNKKGHQINLYQMKIHVLPDINGNWKLTFHARAAIL